MIRHFMVRKQLFCQTDQGYRVDFKDKIRIFHSFKGAALQGWYRLFPLSNQKFRKYKILFSLLSLPLLSSLSLLSLPFLSSLSLFLTHTYFLSPFSLPLFLSPSLSLSLSFYTLQRYTYSITMFCQFEK